MLKNRIKKSLVGSTILSVGWCVSAVSAQDAGGSILIEEVIVTAQKRDQSLQDVGVSVSAVTGDQLRTLGFQNAEDINLHVPGLTTGSFSGDKSVSIFTIRGVGQNDFSDHQEAPTAVYVDGVYVSFPGATGLQMFDLERVEVLRGPQGTLYGRNATGGLVHFISRKPTEEFEGYVNARLASYNNVRVEGAISGPIGDGINARLAGVHNNAKGYIDNRAGKDARADDSTSLRATVDFNGSDTFQASVIGRYNRVDSVGGVYQHVPSRSNAQGLGQPMPDEVDFAGYRDDDGDVLAGSFNPLGYIDKESYSVTAKLNWNLSDSVELVSITDYMDIRKSYMEDSDSSPTELLQFVSGQQSEQFSQELRLDGNREDLRWTAGLYYLDIAGDYSSSIWSIWPLGDGTVAVADSRNAFTQNTETISAFGQVEYDLSESMTLIVGGRIYQDKKNLDLVSRCYGIGGYPMEADVPDRSEWEPVLEFVNGEGVFNEGGTSCWDFFWFPTDGTLQLNEHENVRRDRKDTEWAGKIQLDYRVSDDVLLYASINRGTKGGGFNTPIDGLGDADPAQGRDKVPFDPEVLIAYEVGVKSSLNDGKMRLNASAFYYDYNDYQAFNFVGLTQFQFNTDARIFGLDAELVASLGEGWELMAGLSVLDATVFDVPLPDTVTIVDQKPVMTPSLSVNAALIKRWQLGSGELTTQIDGAYLSSQYFNTVNHPTVYENGYALANARISYRPAEGNWEIAAFAKNIFDERYKQYGFDVSGFGYSLDVYGPPRWLGVELDFQF